MDTTTSSFSKKILIIGQGGTGVFTANEIADFGFEVLLVQEKDFDTDDSQYWTPSFSLDKDKLENAYQRLQKNNKIQHLTGTNLKGCTGSVGKFCVELEKQGEQYQETVGAIVMALELKAEPLFESYGLVDAQNAVSLFQLEKMLDSNLNKPSTAGLPKEDGQIAFLSGFAQEGNCLNQQRIMESISQLQESGYQAYSYTPNLKVAHPELEELYKENRRQGAIYFKIPEKPVIDPEGKQISHKDPVLQENIQLNPDLIVVEEELQTLSEHQRLAKTLGLLESREGFLQENNIHRIPVATNRPGIFTVGSTRELMSFSRIETDAANAAIAVQNCFDYLEENFSTTRAYIDKDKCCYCLTCYRLCPHRAIGLEDTPVISSLACQGCGICASECPQGAISIIDMRWEQIQESVTEMLKGKEHTPQIIAYCCQNSAYEAGIAASMFDHSLPAGLEMVKVTCAGSVNLDLILKTLQKGADGVLVLGCHQEVCKSVKGNTFANWRTQRLRSILEECGFSRERIRFETLAENMDFEFSRYTMEMEKNLKDLGRNPLA